MVMSMIVHARKPKRRRKAEAQAAPLPIGRIVTAKKPSEPRRPEPERFDPEVDAEVRASVAKNMRPLPRD
jgi:hypothetical protein